MGVDALWTLPRYTLCATDYRTLDLETDRYDLRIADLHLFQRQVGGP